jgi:hypothetical protein
LSHISRRIEVSDLFEPIESIGHAFGMRGVRAKEDVVGAHEGAEALETIPLKGFDPDVSYVDVAGVFKEHCVSPSAKCEP